MFPVSLKVPRLMFRAGVRIPRLRFGKNADRRGLFLRNLISPLRSPNITLQSINRETHMFDQSSIRKSFLLVLDESLGDFFVLFAEG